MSKQGYLYAALGEKYFHEAITSINSLKILDKDNPIHIITDVLDSGTPGIDRVINHLPQKGTHDKYGFQYKIEAISSSQFDKTIFLDTDTYLCHPINELFELLDHFDLLICHDYCESDDIVSKHGPHKGYFVFNTGVMAYRKSVAMDGLFQRWNEYFLENNKILRHDQPAFMTALIESGIRFYVLPTIYNFRPQQNLSIHLNSHVKVLHGHYNQEQFKDLDRRINRNTSQRAWVASEMECRDWSTPRPFSLIRKIFSFFRNFLFARL